MKTFDIVSYRLPSFWASYLVNSDDSGLTSEEAKEADRCLAWINKSEGGFACCVGCSDEHEFDRGNDWNGMGGSTALFTFHVQRARHLWRISWGEVRANRGACRAFDEWNQLARFCLSKRRTWGTDEPYSALPHRLNSWKAKRYNSQPLQG